MIFAEAYRLHRDRMIVNVEMYDCCVNLPLTRFYTEMLQGMEELKKQDDGYCPDL
jgi:hypothetical protein